MSEQKTDPGPQRSPASVAGEQAPPSRAEQHRCPTCGHLDPLIAVDCCDEQGSQPEPQGDREAMAAVERLTAALAAAEGRVNKYAACITIQRNRAGYWKREADSEKSAREAAEKERDELRAKLAAAEGRAEKAERSCAAYRHWLVTESGWENFREEYGLGNTVCAENAKKLRDWLAANNVENVGRNWFESLRQSESAREAAEKELAELLKEPTE